MDDVERWELPTLSAPQYECLTWDPEGNDEFLTIGMLSAGWGSGKTVGACARFFREICEIPAWDGRGIQPLAAVIAPVNHNLVANILPMMESMAPPGLITTRRVSPLRYWVTRNGVKIIFLSGDGLVDSFSARVIWIDEATHPTFLEDFKYNRIVSRLRGPWKKRLILSGIAANIPTVRDRYDHPKKPDMRIIMPGLRDNPSLSEKNIDELLALVPHGHRYAVEWGGWLPLSEAIYQLEPELHRHEGPIDKTMPCHLGIDPGNKGVALVAQEIDGGVVIVDEVIGIRQDAEMLCEEVKGRGFSDIRTATVDAQASIDSISQIRRSLPDCHIVQPARGTNEWSIDWGIERVEWSLLAADGRVRLRIHANLWDYPRHPERGLVKSMQEYVRGPTGRPKRDDVVDHQCDALRYVVVTLIQNTHGFGQKVEAEPQYGDDSWDMF